MINVCVPVLKRYDLLKELLESLTRSTVVPDAVYIIDNGRQPARVGELVGIVPFTKVLTPSRPMGVAESWNWFINNVPEERLITNDDIVFAPESLAAMMAAPKWFVSCGFGFSCFIIRDECVADVGLFDERISPGYGYFEDVDYLRRMRLLGVEDSVVQCGVVHKQSQTPAVYTPAEVNEHNQRFAIAKRNYGLKWGDSKRDEWDWGPIPGDTP